jgi:hypothetical protein
MAKNDPIMAGVTLSAGAFGDPRFEYFAELMGYADADHARGKLAKLVSRATALETDGYVPLKVVVYCLGKKAPDALIESDLGELADEGMMRIKGSARTEWFAEMPERGAAGGAARAQAAPRKGGRFVKSTTNHQQTTSDHQQATSEPPASDQQDAPAGDSLDQQPPASPDQDQDQGSDQHTHTGSKSSPGREPSETGGGDQAQGPVTRGALPRDWRPNTSASSRTGAENIEAAERAIKRGVVIGFALQKFLERSRARGTLALDWDAEWRSFLMTEYPTAAPLRDSIVLHEQRKPARAALDRERLAEAERMQRVEADREEVQRAARAAVANGFQLEKTTK